MINFYHLNINAQVVQVDYCTTRVENYLDDVFYVPLFCVSASLEEIEFIYITSYFHTCGTIRVSEKLNFLSFSLLRYLWISSADIFCHRKKVHHVLQ